jgi:hypothetical protein
MAEFAVMLLFPFMTIVVGFVAPDKSPLQPVNSYPAAGVAVTVTVVFGG